MAGASSSVFFCYKPPLFCSISVLPGGLGGNLSQAATQELMALNQLPAAVVPSSSQKDARTPSVACNQLSTSYFYRLLTFCGIRCSFESWTWDSLIPLKHKAFLWLAFRGRLNTKDNMVKKCWSAVAPFAHCDACPAVKSIDHLVLRCHAASALWNKLMLDPLARLSPDILAFVEQAVHQLAFKRKRNVAFAACAITLWHARNDRVFNSKIWTESYTRHYVADMISLWSYRATKQQDRSDLQVWSQKFDS